MSKNSSHHTEVEDYPTMNTMNDKRVYSEKRNRYHMLAKAKGALAERRLTACCENMKLRGREEDEGTL